MLTWALAALLLAGCSPETTDIPEPMDTIEVSWARPFDGARPLDGLDAEGDLLFAIGRGELSAFQIDDGALAWSIEADWSFRPRNPAATDGRVFIAADVVVGFNAQDGTELWRFAPDTLVYGWITTTAEAAFIGTTSGRVYSLAAETGVEQWFADLLPGSQHGGRVEWLTVAGDTLFASLRENLSPTGHLSRGLVFALETTTGDKHWRYVNEVSEERHGASALAVAEGVVLVSDRESNDIIALSRSTGTERWRFRGDESYFGPRHPAVVADGSAYFMSGDANAYGFDIASGNVIWRSPAKGSGVSAALCGESFLTHYKILRKLRLDNGEPLAQLFGDESGLVSGSEWAVSDLLAHGSKVFVAGNQNLYAFPCD